MRTVCPPGLQETCLGQFPELAAATAANILSDCEVGVDHYAGFNSIRNFTPKPMPTVEVRTQLTGPCTAPA